MEMLKETSTAEQAPENDRSASSDALEHVYVQASEWVRMSNTILWAMGTFLVPVSLGCIGLALQLPQQRFFLAPASILVFVFWIYVGLLYRDGTATARSVLMQIESQWGIRDEMSFYRLQGQVAFKRGGLFHTQLAALMVLILLWTIVLLYLPR